MTRIERKEVNAAVREAARFWTVAGLSAGCMICSVLAWAVYMAAV